MAHNNYKSFETERLLMVPTTITDAAFILELFNTPKWIKYIGDRKVRSIEDAENYIRRKMLPQLDKLGYSNYTVIRKEDNIKIGSCGLYDREGLNGVDIGFAFLPEYEKKGYAFESVSKLKEIAVNEFMLVQLSAITIKENTGSQNLLLKLGLQFDKNIRLPDDDEELMLFTIKH